MATRKWGLENEEPLSNENRVSRLWIFDHWMMGIEEREGFMHAEHETLPQPATSDLQDENSVAVWLHNSMAVQRFWSAYLTRVQVAYLTPVEFYYVILCLVHNNLHNYLSCFIDN